MSTAGRTLRSWLRQIILARCANGVIKAAHWETTLPHTTITQKVFWRLPADTFILMLLPMHHTTTLKTETRSSLGNHSLLCHERSFCALTSSTECIYIVYIYMNHRSLFAHTCRVSNLFMDVLRGTQCLSVRSVPTMPSIQKKSQRTQCINSPILCAWHQSEFSPWIARFLSAT